ncbi:T9SS type A sorting domain-containing protein [bacterium]|nr:T9SS type A sorting domain-containing protein [bacterium]
MKLSRILCLLALTIVLIPHSYADGLWEPNDGVQVFQAQNAKFEDIAVAGPDNTSLVVWSDGRGYYRSYYGQLLNAQGEELWRENGLPILDDVNLTNIIGLVHTSDDCFVMFWVTTLHAPDHAYSLYGQKYDIDGTPLWSNGGDPSPIGKLITHFGSGYFRGTAIANSAGGAIVALRNTDNNGPLMGYFVLANGDLDPDCPDSGITLEANPDNSSFGKLQLLPVWSDNPDPEMVGFTAFFVFSPHYYGKRFDLLGNPQWTPERVEIVEHLGARVFTIPAGADSYFTCWTTSGDDILMAQRIAPDGSLQWGSDGSVIVPSNDAFVSTGVSSLDGTAIALTYDDNMENLAAIRFGGTDQLEILWNTPIPTMYTPYSGPNGGAVLVDRTHVQHIDVNGQLQHPDDGLPYAGDHAQYYSATVSGEAVNIYHSLTYAGLDWSYTVSVYSQVYDLQQQQLLNPFGGVLLTRGGLGSAFPHSLLVMDDRAWSTWTGERSGWNLSFVQAQDLETGEILFDSTGICLLPAYFTDPPDSSNHYNSLLGQFNNGDIAALSGFPYRLQRLTPSGQLLWGDGGSLFPPPNEDITFSEPRLFPTDDDGLLLVAKFLQNSISNFFLQKFSSDGTPQWSSGDYNFLTLTDTDTEYWLRFADQLDDGSLIVVYRDLAADDYKIIRVNQDGAISWTLSFPDIGYTCLANNGILITCNDGNASGVHFIDTDGNLVWGDEPLEVDCPVHYLASLKRETDSFWLLWSDGEGGNYLRCYNFSGDLLFPELQIQVDWEEWLSHLIVLPDQSLFAALNTITYYSEDEQVFDNIFYTHILTTGEFAPGYEGVFKTLCDLSGSQRLVAAKSDGADGVVYLWQDYRAFIPYFGGAGVYTQRVNDFLESAPEPIATPNRPNTWIVSTAYPNPFNATTSIHIDLPQRAHLKAQVYDILGREVMTLADQPFSAGRHTLTVDASRLASGMYFLRVNQPGGMTRMQKLVLLK